MNLLYSVARNSILEGLEKGQPLDIQIESYPVELQKLGAAFITLRRGGERDRNGLLPGALVPCARTEHRAGLRAAGARGGRGAGGRRRATRTLSLRP